MLADPHLLGAQIAATAYNRDFLRSLILTSLEKDCYPVANGRKLSGLQSSDKKPRFCLPHTHSSHIFFKRSISRSFKRASPSEHPHLL